MKNNTFQVCPLTVLSAWSSLGVVGKLHLGDWLVMDSNSEKASLHMQGLGYVQWPSPIPLHIEEPSGIRVQ